MSVEPEYIGIDDTFNFSCSPDVTCFNQCCHDVNQFLYPYDILRLKQHLAISSTELLAMYTVTYSGDTTSLPIVAFKTSGSDNNACPFVTEKGCGVYENRPASCRIFPLARAISRSRETGKITEHFALIRDPICMGFTEGRQIRVRNWIIEQGIEEYNRANDRMIELISLKQQIMPGPLSDSDREKFTLGCYDIDRFLLEIKAGRLVDPDVMTEELLERISTDDTALLDFGLKWVASELFGKKING